MFLQPSEIRFSQDSIGNTFGHYTNHPYKPIGETLDDILSGSVTSLPDISVTLINGLWYTADSRRLWVLQQAEQCGEIDDIYVSLINKINPNKFTTENDGISVEVRGTRDVGCGKESWTQMVSFGERLARATFVSPPL